MTATEHQCACDCAVHIARDNGLRLAALAQELCEEVGLNWSDDATRVLAQRAIRRAERRVVGDAP